MSEEITIIFRCSGGCDGERCVVILEDANNPDRRPPSHCPFGKDDEMNWSSEVMADE